MKPSVSRFLSMLGAALLAGCIGGTGTDTENGVVVDKGPLEGHKGTAIRVVDGDGKPLVGIAIALHTPGYRADSGAAENRLLDSIKTLVTDTLGYSKFHLASPGKYVAEGRRGDTTLFFDTLAVSDVKSLAAYTFRAHPSASLRGRVRLASGLQVVSGKVFLRGTGRLAVLAADGTYDLGILPPEVVAMDFGLTYQSKATEARVAEQKLDTARVTPGVLAKPFFTCREVPVDSAAKLSSGGPEKGMISLPAFSSSDTAKLDTARVAAVDKACAAVPGGTVIAVRTPDTGVHAVMKDSVTTNYIAVNQGIQKAVRAPEAMTGIMDQTLVPLNGCVALPGTTTTSFELRLNPSALSSDLLVADVADKCLAK